MYSFYLHNYIFYILRYRKVGKPDLSKQQQSVSIVFSTSRCKLDAKQNVSKKCTTACLYITFTTSLNFLILYKQKPEQRLGKNMTERAPLINGEHKQLKRAFQ